MNGWDRPWFRARRHQPPSTFDLSAAIGQLEDTVAARIKPGQQVAVLVGSRGIAQLADVVTAVVGVVQRRGAKVTLVPAMGSHGGATPQGQIGILHEHGVDPAGLGVAVDASMETEQIGTLASGAPVFTAKSALAADAVIPVNRVKPHTDFRAPVESGLTKMLTIGLGKNTGASSLHAQGFDQFHQVLPDTLQVVLGRVNVPFGVAVVEDPWHRLEHLEGVPGEDILARDRELLERAWKNLGLLPFSRVDLLVLRELGKNISGAGLDPNVTGRWSVTDLGGATKVARLVVLDLTDDTAGNACGVGLADVVTERLRAKVDWPVTYRNSLTSKALDGCKLPLVASSDREAIELAVSSFVGVDGAQARMVATRNTLTVADLAISEELLPEAEAAGYQIDSHPKLASFDRAGNLLTLNGLPFFQPQEHEPLEKP